MSCVEFDTIAYDLHIVLDLPYMQYRQQLHVRYTFTFLEHQFTHVIFQVQIDLLDASEPHFQALCNALFHACCGLLVWPHWLRSKNASKLFPVKKKCDLSKCALNKAAGPRSLLMSMTGMLVVGRKSVAQFVMSMRSPCASAL